MPTISGPRGMTPDVPHAPRSVEEKVDAIIKDCREMDAPRLYQRINREFPEWIVEPAIEQMLQVAGKNGTLAQYKAHVARGDFEAIAEIMPSPDFIAQCLEKLKEPGVFREFLKFTKELG